MKPRKIHKQGGSYMVSLPIEWVRKTDVLESCTVAVEMDANLNLIITPLRYNKRSKKYEKYI